jgi:hypothetical protein
MVLTNVVMMSMWWIGMLLAFVNETWIRLMETMQPKLQFFRNRPNRKPPDPDSVTKFLHEYLEREEALGVKRSFVERLFRLPLSSNRMRYMLLALNASVALARSQPQILLREHVILRNQLRRYKRSGLLSTTRLCDDIRLRLRRKIADEPIGFLSCGGDFDLIIDTGCTKTGTGYVNDFIPGSLRNLPIPIQMDGIAGGLKIQQEGKVKYEFVNDKGNIQSIETDAYHIPKLQCRLFSPQAYFRQMLDDGIDTNEDCGLSVKARKSVMTLANKAQVSVFYDNSTHLPRLHAYKSALHSANMLAMQGCVTDEMNQNLTPQQKILLKWHFRLGHLGFAAVQWLGRSGMLGPFGEKMGAA